MSSFAFESTEVSDAKGVVVDPRNKDEHDVSKNYFHVGINCFEIEIRRNEDHKEENESKRRTFLCYPVKKQA